MTPPYSDTTDPDALGRFTLTPAIGNHDVTISHEGLARAYSLVFALLALVILLPVLIAIAALIAITTRANPLFYHQRLGRNGRHFNCLKFRTMHNDAERRIAELLKTDTMAADEWRRYHKLTNDPRIAGRLGRFLRASGLDELPQIWNIIRGDMNIVGPRPITRDELAHFANSAARLLSRRPGLTGQWQIQPNRNAMPYLERARIELDYIDNGNFWRDLKIISKTASRILAHDGR